MFEIIMGGVFAICLGIIANILTPYFKEFFKTTPPIIQNLPEQNSKEKLETPNIEFQRAINREKLDNILSKIYFYIFSYIVMYLAFYIPISIKGNLIHPNINLIESKLAIDFVINESNLAMLSAIFGVLIYFPLWKLSQIIANIISSIVVKFIAVDEIRYLVFVVLVMIFWAFFIAGNVFWVLGEETSWFHSIKFSLLIWLLLFLSLFSKK